MQVDVHIWKLRQALQKRNRLPALRKNLESHSSQRIAVPLPIDKLTCKRAAHQPGSPYRPVVLLSCGSFNPPTLAHLRMFELAAHELAKVSLWERKPLPLHNGT